jgi:tRNA(His) guanylyltransferase
MAFSEFDIAMKQLEWYRGENLPKGVWPILRIDGRSFTKTTQTLGYDKPYDQRFHFLMTDTAQAVLNALDGVFAYHQSDEISILLPPKTEIFDRRVEKLVSVSASVAAAVFNQNMPPYVEKQGEKKLYPHFDARLVCAISFEDVKSYFLWRQQDATRNALNSWCHWTAIKNKGLSATRAATLFNAQSVEFKNEWLFRQGINFSTLPLWQRRGTAIVWEQYMKSGFNPKTEQKVDVSRWRTAVDNDLPKGDEYKSYLERELEIAFTGKFKQYAFHGEPAAK